MKMKLILVCLLPIYMSRHSNMSQLGFDYDLDCFNDYLFTISCVLNVSTELLDHNATSWLEFYDDRGAFECALEAQAGSWVCELDLTDLVEDSFLDTDIFQISLNYSYHSNSQSAVLETDYRPVKQIRPLPPSNLSLLWETGQIVFDWLSGYPEDSYLEPKLQYQLNIFCEEQELTVHPNSKRAVVDMSHFKPYTSCTVRVRSQPNQVHYAGVWSHWGPAVYWTTGAIHSDSLDMMDESFPLSWFALFFLAVLPFFYVTYSRWKKHLLIPSPAPYLMDYKSWATLPGGVGEVLPGEESLKIDSMIEENNAVPQPGPTHHDKMISASDSSDYDPPESPSTLQSMVKMDVDLSDLLNEFSTAEKVSITCSDDYCALSLTHPEQAVNPHQLSHTHTEASPETHTRHHIHHTMNVNTI